MRYKKMIGLVCLIATIFIATFILRSQKLSILEKKQQECDIFPQDLRAQQTTLNLTGNALILYNVSSDTYFPLSVERIQFQNTPSVFKLSLRGIRGSLIRYFQQIISYDFEQQLTAYNPAKELLSNPLLSLLILENNLVNLNIEIKAIQTAPNQIAAELEIYNGHVKKARFTAKFTPSKQPKSILQQFRNTTPRFQLDYISPDWKQKIDDYCFSKDLPFIIENTEYSFSF